VMESAATSGSSAMPPASEQWNQPWSDALRSQGRGTFHPRSYALALVSRTRTISGAISTLQYALPRRDSIDRGATILASSASGAKGTYRRALGVSSEHSERPEENRAA